MSDFPFFLLVPSGIAITALLVSRLIETEKRKVLAEADKGTILFQAQHASGKVQIYCRSCGKPLESLRNHQGFNGETGQPIYKYSRRCPDWKMPSPTGSASGAALHFYEDYVNCYKPGTWAFTKGHNHEGPDVDTACPACIDIMLKDGIIDEKAAAQLYTAAGL